MAWAAVYDTAFPEFGVAFVHAGDGDKAASSADLDCEVRGARGRIRARHPWLRSEPDPVDS
jgi:hypothetical protein